ncbi:boophilin-H2-like [Ixodes scapularis]|uniref:boophilin-H2-like n=1 Tax=Ixodes scapularis TaxID=6945 RepID=UPI001A9DE4A0|nr:boophilin-H2-like [Ixodes scapularis]
MKATIGVICVFSAVLLISAISVEECRAPRPQTICDNDATVTVQHYFNSDTGKCEEESGCNSGPNNFPTKEKCQKECPYCEFALCFNIYPAALCLSSRNSPANRRFIYSF